MDPNETLRRILENADFLREHEDDEDPGYHPDHEVVSELLEDLAALDGWLSKGGFAPSRWAPKPTKGARS